MRAIMLQRISRTLVNYREAALWYLLVAAAVVTIALAGGPTGRILPAAPRALPPLRTVQPPPPTVTIPPTTTPATVPPITTPPTTAPPPTVSVPPTSTSAVE